MCFDNLQARTAVRACKYFINPKGAHRDLTNLSAGRDVHTGTSQIMIRGSVQTRIPARLKPARDFYWYFLKYNQAKGQVKPCPYNNINLLQKRPVKPGQYKAVWLFN
jgi:hypothetical protein